MVAGSFSHSHREKRNIYLMARSSTIWMGAVAADCLSKHPSKVCQTTLSSRVCEFFRFVTRAGCSECRNGKLWVRRGAAIFSAFLSSTILFSPAPNCRIIKRHSASDDGAMEEAWCADYDSSFYYANSHKAQHSFYLIYRQPATSVFSDFLDAFEGGIIFRKQ